MAYRNEKSQHTLHFVYISQGIDLQNWEDENSGAKIDVLAFGTGDDTIFVLADQILKKHEVHTIMLPKISCANEWDQKGERNREKEICRRFTKKGVAEVLSGEGTLLYKGWKFVYWTDGAFLSVYHERPAHDPQESLIMEKAVFTKDSGCSPYLEQDEDYCGMCCCQQNDFDLLGRESSLEDEICIGTLILSGGAGADGNRYTDFIRANRKRIRAILFTMDGRDFPQISEILKENSPTQYCYYLGGHGDAGLAGITALSGPGAHYQTLEDGYGVCISGSFLKEETDDDCTFVRFDGED